MEPVSPAASLSETLMGAQSPACETGDDAEELRKRRDREFLASLPPQLALKRRRTSNNKQKEKILAELLQPAEACPAAARRPTVAAAQPAAAADFSEPLDEPAADDEPADAAALKRKKNTDAARRSRMRKILRIETLESRVSELEGENTRLSQLVAQLEAEKAAMARAVL
ncbi:hypothetical protein IWQ57_006766 [Coemansia nantahalensis]|uniref:Uncharacterized protein n=2 Tax=Coemansia TaxID=4863 RepID=A0ACC1JIP7_9FUNG|nr:hypothetical protein IWQ57_006766 [Coemansia nantahalensis]